MNLSSTPGEYRFQVPFHDVDAARIVWHGHFYKYFEYARTELMRLHDLDVEQIVDLGYGMVVSQTRCRHLSPVRYGDELLVRASFQEANHRLLVGYAVENLTQECTAARGRTGLVVVDDSMSFIRGLPDVILDRIREDS